MVGVVLVSHSANLVAGIRELIGPMVPDSTFIALAGGLDDPDNSVGTDATRVLAAIEQVYSDDGVVVLMDLGSALMSAELALELLSPEQRSRVRLCAAPLVEGAVAAAVQAGVGADLDSVVAEAMGALAAKARQLGAPEETVSAAPPADRPAREGAETRTLTLVVPNPLGLHARPAAQFVATANRFKANVRVVKGALEANGKSINQVATLGARRGDEITIMADGPDAVRALAAIQALADDYFGDRPDALAPATAAGKVASQPPPSVTEGALIGLPASPGFGLGPALLFRPVLPEIPDHSVTDPAAEWRRLTQAVTRAEAELEAIANQTRLQAGSEEAAIFQAHQLIIQDPDLLAEVRAAIMGRFENAAYAWSRVIGATAARYQALSDPYLQARAQDVQDAGQRVLRQLLNLSLPPLQFDHPVILLARDLAPSDTARLGSDQVLAICTELGGPTAHSAILARALGIPAIVGLGPGLWQVADGQVVGVDGDSGRLWLEPDAEQRDRLAEARREWLARQAAERAASQGEAWTRDGRRIEVAANIGGPRDVALAADAGAEGVGLFRTEFLFMDRPEPPGEDEQTAIYEEVARTMGPRPVIIRTLDIGGDKPVPYLDLGAEANPFLGWRGIRFCLDRPDIFQPQLRAILRAAHANGRGTELKLMFPMVSTVAEVRAARAELSRAREALTAAGKEQAERIDIGIMIETPAAVQNAADLAAEVDFFSLGTNDLTQYIMAADRGNNRVADLANAFQPAVLRAIAQTVAAAHAAGIWVGLCGELAGKPEAVELLIGLGIDELSMSAPAIPAVKNRIRQLDSADAAATAKRILAAQSLADIQRELVL